MTQNEKEDQFQLMYVMLERTKTNWLKKWQVPWDYEDTIEDFFNNMDIPPRRVESNIQQDEGNPKGRVHRNL